MNLTSVSLLCSAVALFASATAVATAREPAGDPTTRWIYANRRLLVSLMGGAGLVIGLLAFIFIALPE